MFIKTKLFGDIDVSEDKIIEFHEGIIGFPEMKKFTLIANEEEDKKSSIFWLQSVEEGVFAIPVVSPFVVREDFNPTVEDELLKPIGGLKEENISVMVTITVPSEIEKMTVNLKAPMIINSATMKGIQLIIEDDDYPVRYPIYDILKKKKEGD